MGLDMYIYKIKKMDEATLDDAFAVEYWFELQEYKKEHPEYTGTMKKWCGMKKPTKKVIEFYRDAFPEEVAYWRKANMIHLWFVKNVQDGKDDCQAHRPVTKEDLKKLRQTCIKVLNDPGSAKRRLPTTSGFFFGVQDYENWYFEVLRETVNTINELLKFTDFDKEELYYVSSW